MSGCSVLTKERFEKLLAGELSAAEAEAIHAHLETECEACDEFLAQMDDAAEMELGRIYQDEMAAATDDNATSTDAITKPSKSRHGNSAWLGMAALLLVMVSLLPMIISEEPELQRMKSAAPVPASIDLIFSSGRRTADGSLNVNRGRSGGKYSPEDTLFFQYSISSSGYVYLAGYSPKEGVKLLYPSNVREAVLLPAGTYQLTQPEGLVAFTLQGMKGDYRFVSLYSHVSFDSNEALVTALAESIDSGGKLDYGRINNISEGAAIDVVDITVLPEVKQ